MAAIAREVVGDFDDTVVGYESEDSKIGGAGAYGVDVSDTRLIWPGHVKDITPEINENKEVKREVGCGRDFNQVDDLAKEYGISITYEPRPFYGSVAINAPESIWGLLLGSDPETISAAPVYRDITNEDQLGSFTMEWGESDAHIYDRWYLAVGCVINTLNLTMKTGEFLTISLDIIAKNITHANTCVDCTTTDVSDLALPDITAGRRWTYSDATITDGGGLLDDFIWDSFDLTVDNKIDRIPGLGSEYTYRPQPNEREITGTFSVYRRPDVSDANTLLEILEADPIGAADVSYLDSITIIIGTGAVDGDLRIVLDNVVLMSTSDARSNKEGSAGHKLETYDFVAQTITVSVYDAA